MIEIKMILDKEHISGQKTYFVNSNITEYINKVIEVVRIYTDIDEVQIKFEKDSAVIKAYKENIIKFNIQITAIKDVSLSDAVSEIFYYNDLKEV